MYPFPRHNHPESAGKAKGAAILFESRSPTHQRRNPVRSDLEDQLIIQFDGEHALFIGLFVLIFLGQRPRAL